MIENIPVASIEATGVKPKKTAEITAEAIGTSRAKVERARTVLADPEEAAAVRRGDKTIHQAAHDAKAKRDSISPHGSAGSKRRQHSKPAYWPEEDALSEGHRILLLLNALSASDPNESHRASYKSAAVIVRRALK